MPSNPYPADAADNIDLSVTLAWNCSDPESHSLEYSLFVGESGYDTVLVDTDIQDEFYTLSRLKPGTSYTWKVLATDGQAFSDGPTWVFRTQDIAPVPPKDPV